MKSKKVKIFLLVCVVFVFLLVGLVFYAASRVSPAELKKLAETITQELYHKNGVGIVGFMPWSWRKVFNLPTLVKADGQSVKYQMVAKIIGHDILKKQSVDLVQNNKKQFLGEGPYVIVEDFKFYSQCGENHQDHQHYLR